MLHLPEIKPKFLQSFNPLSVSYVELFNYVRQGILYLSSICISLFIFSMIGGKLTGYEVQL